eukprot:3018015-Lingulodinium_polyedra.AAC.1
MRGRGAHANTQAQLERALVVPPNTTEHARSQEPQPDKHARDIQHTATALRSALFGKAVSQRSNAAASDSGMLCSPFVLASAPGVAKSGLSKAAR